MLYGFYVLFKIVRHNNLITAYTFKKTNNVTEM